LRDFKRVAGPSSYPSGGFDVVLGELEGITSRGLEKEEGVISVEASDKTPAAINGYLGLEATTIEANTVTVKCYDVVDANTSVSEVTAGANLSSVYFTVEVEGH